RFIECHERLSDHRTILMAFGELGFHSRTDLEFTDLNTELGEGSDNLTMIFITQGKMAYVIATPYMCLEHHFRYRRPYVESFSQHLNPLWQQLAFVPVDKLLAGFQYTVRLRFYVQMEHFTLAFMDVR